MPQDRMTVMRLSDETDAAAFARFRQQALAVLEGAESLGVDMSRAVSLQPGAVELLLELRDEARARGVRISLLYVPERLVRALQLVGIGDDFDQDSGEVPAGLSASQIAGVDRPQIVPLPERIELADADDPHFEQLTALAREAVGTQRACVVLLDRRRQVFVGRAGPPYDAPREDPLTESLCQHVVTGAGPLVLRDATTVDIVGAGRAPYIAAYAGVPLTDHTGRVVGAFCVTDDTPREWTAHDLDVLAGFARSASSELQLRSAVARTAVLADRERLATRLGDAVFRELVAVALLIDSARSVSTGRQADLLSEASDTLEATIKNLRTAVFDTSS